MCKSEDPLFLPHSSQNLIFFPEIQNLLFSVYEIQFGRYFFVHVVLPFFLFNVCKILLDKLFYKVKKAAAAKRTKA